MPKHGLVGLRMKSAQSRPTIPRSRLSLAGGESRDAKLASDWLAWLDRAPWRYLGDMAQQVWNASKAGNVGC